MMKKFMLFILGLVALIVLLANLVPTILLGLGVWLLYTVFKKFLKTSSLAKKIVLIIIGMVTALFSIFNIHGLIGLAAGYGVYTIYRKLSYKPYSGSRYDDPFQNFEKQWKEIQHS